MSELIKPTPLVLKCEDGKERTYILSNFPAVDGREIVSKYIAANMPRVGDYKESEEIMIKLMSYVAVKNGSVETRLSTRDLINNHCPGFEELMKIEMAMMEKNCSFFRDGRSLDFFESLNSDGGEESVRNVDPLIGTIISHGKASLTELKTCLDLEEAMQIWEIIMVSKYNEYQASKKVAGK